MRRIALALVLMAQGCATSELSIRADLDRLGRPEISDVQITYKLQYEHVK